MSISALWHICPEETPPDGTFCIIIVEDVYQLAIYTPYFRDKHGRFAKHGWFVETIGEHGTWIGGEVFWYPAPEPPVARCKLFESFDEAR